MASDEAAASEAVCVAVNVRPLVDSELIEGCRAMLQVTPGQPQVGHPPHLFTFDHVFGTGGEPSCTLYDRCVSPLVDGLFKGYNGCVFAYGQTGSGKTYTMGSAFAPGGEARGVIPSVMDAIFDRVASALPHIDYTVRVGFVEIHKEEIHDLLCTGRGPHPVVHIREVAGGGVCLAGAAEKEVHSRQEMVEVLEHGTLLRATAATGMNKQSSRSHAIFTITLEQRRLVEAAQPPARRSGGGGEGTGQDSNGDDDDDDDEEEEEEAGAGGDDSYLCAKMHLVDLAGSERAKRTKAVGARLQEGININRGLLALGNVINALSEGKAHVPYRDSKLTRMLQDSLGGNSRTAMIACVSPADVNLEETINTLRYANRARNIRNKPVVNRDPVAAQIAQLRQACASLRAENASLKSRLGEGGSIGLLDFGGPGDEVLRGAVEELEARSRQLQAENQRLRVEAEAARSGEREATEKMIVAQVQRDRLCQRLHALDPAAAEEAAREADAIADGTGSEGDVVRGHLERIAELEREVKRLKQVSRLSGAFAITRRQSLGAGAGAAMAADLPLHASPFHLTPLLRDGAEDGEPGEGGQEQEISALELQDEEFVAQEQAHSNYVARLHGELSRLQHEMEQKQAAILNMNGHHALKQRYDEVLLDLRQQLAELERERRELLQKLESLQHASEDERLRLRSQYEARIQALDGKFKAVAAKEKRAAEMERMKRKAEETCSRLQHDIHGIKQQKVSLQRQMDKSTREFTEWKKQRDRELLQLKKQGRLNAAQLQKLEALHSKQQAVLRRKTEEAEAARRRLKEMEDRKHRLASSRPPTAAAGAASAASAADRPFTAPAAAFTAGAGRPPLSGGEGSGGGVERSSVSATAAVAAAVADLECQPNQMAPLLRDEKGRREWVEGELEAYCSSYELQKVMEGERVQRSEVQRKLREVEKALAALKAPEWWPGYTSSPSSANEDKLQARRAALLQQREVHSQRFEQAQAKLMEARAAEDAKGGVPADARRWNGVRTVVQARALLKTVFRAASQHKAEAMEVQAQLADLNDEIELLKLRLDIAEQEKYEAAQQVAKAEVLLKLAEERGDDEDPAAAATPAKQLLPPQLGARHAPSDEGLREAHNILQQLNVLAAGESQLAVGDAPGGVADDQDSSAAEEDEEDGSASEGDSWDDYEDGDEEEEEEEEEEQSEDEERHALWDPSCATPARGLKSRRHGGAAARGAAAASGGCSGEAEEQQQQAQRHAQRRRRSSAANSSPLLPEEQPVLNHLNEQLRKAGKEAVARPTVPLMKAVLKDKMIGGQRWRAGSKKRDELIRDYRLLLGLQPEVLESPSAAATGMAAGSGGSGGSGNSGGSAQQQQVALVSARSAGEGGPVRSRILEHTASSLARCAATQQEHQQQHPRHQPLLPPPASASAAAAPTARGFGSPLPPARSRAGSASAEHPDASTTPMGAEGQQTPEAAELEAPATSRLTSPALGEDGSGAGRQRDLQLHALRQQLSALTVEGAITLGMNPDTLAAAEGAAAAAAGASGNPAPFGRSRSDAVVGGSHTASGPSSQQASPLRRALSVFRPGQGPGGGRDGGGSGSGRPDTVPGGGRALRLQPERSASPGDDSQPASPALIYQQRAEQFKQDAVTASQQIDASLLHSGGSGGSPGRLARLLGRESPSKAKQGGSGSSGAAAPEATYDLQQQHPAGKVAGPPPAAGAAAVAAANPLRSSNSTSDGGGCAGGGAAGGSRTGSPRAGRDFRISSFSPENRSGATSPQQPAGLAGAAGSSGGGGRPRSGSGGAVSRPQTSPTKKVWKPL